MKSQTLVVAAAGMAVVAAGVLAVNADDEGSVYLVGRVDVADPSKPATAVVLTAGESEARAELPDDGAFAVGPLDAAEFEVTVEFADGHAAAGQVSVRRSDRVLALDVDRRRTRVGAVATETSDDPQIPERASAITLVAIFPGEDVPTDPTSMSVRVRRGSATVFERSIGDDRHLAVALLAPATYEVEATAVTALSEPPQSCAAQVQLAATPILVQIAADADGCRVLHKKT